MMAAKLLMLDATNTILRVRGSVGEQYARVALRLGIKLDPSSVNGAFASAYQRQYLKNPNFGIHNNLTTKEWWRRVVKSVISDQRATIAGDVFELFFEEIYKIFATREAWEMTPYVWDTLQAIRSIEDMKIGIVSNNDQRLHAILDDLRLSHLFDFVLLSTEVGSAKPAPLIFLKALTMGQCEPQDAVHVGDSYQLDYVAPRNLGIRAYLLDSGGRAPEHVRLNGHALGDLRQVLPLLQEQTAE